MYTLIIESFRRVLTALLLLLGTICFWFLDGPWPTVQLVDFSADLKNSPYFVPKGTTVESFREKRTEGRTVVTRSETWYLLAQQLATDNLPGALHRMDMGRGRAAWVVPQWALPPIAEGIPLDYRWGVYVNLEGTDLWLWVEARTAREIGDLPISVKTPMRGQAWGLFLAAVAVYVLLPRRKPAPGELTYGRVSAVVVPDWLGFVMCAFFLSLGMLVISDHHYSLSGGWGWFASVIGLMSLLFLLLPGISTYYATFHLRLLDDGIALTRWGKESVIYWTDVVSAAPYRGKANWVIGLLLILAARGPGMTGQGLLVMSNQEQGLELKLNNGKKVRVMANALRGFETIEAAIKKHIPLTNTQ